MPTVPTGPRIPRAAVTAPALWGGAVFTFLGHTARQGLAGSVLTLRVTVFGREWSFRDHFI